MNTVEALAFASKRELTEIKGMSDAKVAKVKEAGEFHSDEILILILEFCSLCSWQHYHHLIGLLIRISALQLHVLQD